MGGPNELDEFDTIDPSDGRSVSGADANQSGQDQSDDESEDVYSTVEIESQRSGDQRSGDKPSVIDSRTGTDNDPRPSADDAAQSPEQTTPTESMPGRHAEQTKAMAEQDSAEPSDDQEDSQQGAAACDDAAASNDEESSDPFATWEE